MNTRQTHWNLGAKLALPFLLLALLSTVATLWVSWQLDGGAAAVNEAGRMRMQAYRLALTVSSGESAQAPAQVEEFRQSLQLLRSSDAELPLRRMVEAIRQGALDRFVPFDRQGQPLLFS